MIALPRLSFADTVFWVGLCHQADQYHDAATAWSGRLTRGMVTTVPVLDETASALAKPPLRRNVVELIDSIIDQKSHVKLIEPTADQRRRAWRMFRQHADKAWSWVDCISFIVMRDRNITDALTADLHFRQAGFRALLLETP